MKLETDMDLQQFERCLDRYGAELSRWPEPERAAGRRALESSAEARSLQAEAVRVARLLDEVETIEPTPLLLERLLEVPRRHPRTHAAPETRRTFSWWPFGGVFQPTLALAAAAALGILTGSLVTEGGFVTEGDSVVEGAWRGDGTELAAGYDAEDAGFTEEELEEMSEVAFALHLGDGWGALP